MQACYLDTDDYPGFGCQIIKGYKPILVLPKNYLGCKAEFDRPNLFEVTIRLEDNVQANDFYNWWAGPLVYGRANFYITLPVFGSFMKLEVNLDNDISSVFTDGMDSALEVPLILEMIGQMPTSKEI